MSKWFYNAQSEADKELRKRYKHVTTSFQVIDKERVANLMICWNDGDPERDTLLVVITNQGHQASILIYRASYIQGWPTELSK